MWHDLKSVPVVSIVLTIFQYAAWQEPAVLGHCVRDDDEVACARGAPMVETVLRISH
jgi:hypothetical protein